MELCIRDIGLVFSKYLFTLLPTILGGADCLPILKKNSINFLNYKITRYMLNFLSDV